MNKYLDFATSRGGLMIITAGAIGTGLYYSSRKRRVHNQMFLGGGGNRLQGDPHYLGEIAQKAAVTTRKQTKKFNGKTYRLDSVHPTKAKANSKASSLRSNGYNARVEKAIETRKAASKKTWYIVYSKRK